MKLLSVQAVADELGLSGRTVRRLVQRGELRAYSLGRAVRIEADSIDQYLCANKKHVPMDLTSISATASTTPTRETGQAEPVYARVIAPKQSKGSKSYSLDQSLLKLQSLRKQKRV